MTKSGIFTIGLILIIVLAAILFLTGGQEPAPVENEEPETNQSTTTPPTTGTTTPPQGGSTTTPPQGGTPSGQTREFTISGKPFEFSQKEITVNRGDTVKINFRSENGMHDFVVDEFGAKTDTLQTGQSDTITFVADKTGTFEYYCSVGNHRAMGMKGNLIVK